MTPALAASILTALAAAHADVQRLGPYPSCARHPRVEPPRYVYESRVYAAINAHLSPIVVPGGAALVPRPTGFATGEIPSVAADLNLHDGHASIRIRATDTPETICAAWDRIVLSRIANLQALLTTTPKATA